jgi:small subunit ribosomal protein S10e
MLIPKKNRKLVYEYLFKEGVLVAKKDFNLPSHPDIKDVPNLQVIKALQSLKSRGYVKEQFSWRWYYWYLTNEGIQYLREYLHLPPEIVPATLKRPVRTETAKPRPRESDRPSRDDRDDRESYRKDCKLSLHQQTKSETSHYIPIND